MEECYNGTEGETVCSFFYSFFNYILLYFVPSFFFGRDLFLEGRLMAGQINEKLERRETKKAFFFLSFFFEVPLLLLC